mgnify:CR=1 FL=1
MPIYEYQCEQCGHKLEVMQRMTDERLKTCPACNTDNLRKLISAVGFQLKGTGWYETDFKNSGKPTAASSEKKGSDGKAESGDSKKSEAKSDNGDSKESTKSSGSDAD